MKYSENLQSILGKIQAVQPELVEMLDKYVLSNEDQFCSDYYCGKWVEPSYGMVYTHRTGVTLFLYEDHLTLSADALSVAAVANSITEDDHCSVEVSRMFASLKNKTCLHLEAEWRRNGY